MKLNLGCGRRKLKGTWINVDRVKHDNVDVVHNLDTFPYPFTDNSVDYIYMHDVIEHLANPYECMIECHRILKPKGIIEIITSHKNHLSSYDIAHKSYFTERSMCHLTKTNKQSDHRIHRENELLGSSLQCRPLFNILLLKVTRYIPTPFGYIKGFNIYKNAIGVGIKLRIHWKMEKA